MKKFLLITALLVPAVAFAADTVVAQQSAPSTTPEYVTIEQTGTAGLFRMIWTDPVRSPLSVAMQFTEQRVENGIVHVGYTLNGVFQEDQWYSADFSNVVVLFKEGTQKLYTVTPEQREMIIEAELSVDEKAEVLQAAQDARVETLQELVRKAKEVIEAEAAQQEDAVVAEDQAVQEDAVADEDTQEQEVTEQAAEEVVKSAVPAEASETETTQSVEAEQVDAPVVAEQSVESTEAEVTSEEQDEAAEQDAVEQEDESESAVVEQEDAVADQEAQEQVEDTDADDSDEQAVAPTQDVVDARDAVSPEFTD